MIPYAQGFLGKMAQAGLDPEAVNMALRRLAAIERANERLRGISEEGYRSKGISIGGMAGLVASAPSLLSAGLGAGIGALLAPRDGKTRKKNRAKAALIGALLGIPVGNAAIGALAGRGLGGLFGKSVHSGIVGNTLNGIDIGISNARKAVRDIMAGG